MGATNAPRYGGATHANDHDNRSRHCEVGLPVDGVDAADQVVIRRQLKRRPVLAFFEKLRPCLIGIEACASSHHWSRELQALGHTVRLMPPAYVKPYVKRHEERCDRCGGHLRGSHQGEHAVRRDQDARAAELPDTPPHTPFAHPAAADGGDQVSREIRRNGGSQAYRANRADRHQHAGGRRYTQALSFGAVQRATMARGAEARAAMVAAADLRLAEAGVLSRRKRTSGHG